MATFKGEATMQMQDAAEMKRQDGFSERDSQYGIDMAWTGKTIVIEPGLFTLDYPNLPLRQWNVRAEAGVFADGKSMGVKMLRATDDGLPIGEPFRDSYTVIDNATFLAIMRDSTAGTGMQLVSMGSVNNRSQVFATFALADCQFELRKGDVWKPFLNFNNGLADRITNIGANTSIWRQVCRNSARRSLRDTKGSVVNVRYKHTKNVGDKIPNIAQIIDAYVGTSAQFAQAMREIAAVPCDKPRAHTLALGVFGTRGKNNEPLISTRGKNSAERIVALFERGAGNRGESILDVVNAFTDYYSHESRGGDNRYAQWLSSEYGAGADAKEFIIDTMTDGDKREETYRLGRELLATV